MTTIGYGNTAPETTGGRAMIYTLGFLSILLFAGILAKAGSIIVAVVDDWLNRIKLSCLTRPSVQVIIWGAFYYLWLLMIASYYIYWVKVRLDDEIGYREGYWYAYITTTTVGLGDFYLEHAAITGIDLLLWPLLILYGFVWLSSFLTKLGELFSLLRPSKRPPFDERLAKDERPMFSCCPNWFQRQYSITGSTIRGEGGLGQEDQNDGGSVTPTPQSLVVGSVAPSVDQLQEEE